MKNNYGHDFYVDRHQNTAYSARTILSHVLDVLPPVHSAIDFGCGVGTWLAVLRERGISEIQGIDGPWVERDLLEIPAENFRPVNFEETIIHGKRYDLAISLEVAEHISKGSADTFVDSLVGASDFILFSAAVPFQSGVGHVNEQWPDYWTAIFAAREYGVLDFVRKKIWNDRKIPVWYRQNILLFARRERISSGVPTGLGGYENHSPLTLVHPDLYLSKVTQLESEIAEMSSVSGSFRLFRQAASDWVKKRINQSS